MIGWARKVRQHKRLTIKQKGFIKELFDQGERDNINKLTPDQMLKEMKKKEGTF